MIKQRKQARSVDSRRMLAVAFALILIGGAPAHGQSAPNYQSYDLKHVRAADAEARIAELLGSGAVHTVVDARSNRLLVSGSPQSQEAARQVLLSIDQPIAATPSQPIAGLEPGVLKNYPVDPAKLGDATAWLQDRYRMMPEVRIAADPSQSQVLVMAPALIHDHIAPLFPKVTAPAPQQMTPSQNSAAIASSLPQPPSQVAQANFQFVQNGQQQNGQQTTPRKIVLPLRNTRTDTLESSLRNLSGTQKVQAASVDAELAVYSHPIRGTGEGVTLTIDRRSNSVSISGPEYATTEWSRAVGVLDTASSAGNDNSQLLKITNSEKNSVRKVVAAIQAEAGFAQQAVLHNLSQSGSGNIMLAQASPGEQSEQSLNATSQANQDAITQAAEAAAAGGLIGSVQIEFLEGLDMIVIRGNKRDVDRVASIINDIEQRSIETLPMIEIYQLQHVHSQALANLIQQVYDQSLAPRQSSVSITPLVKPNALLLIGREESVRTVMDLASRLDQPVEPSSQFQVFFLKYASAGTVQSSIQEFFSNRTGLGTRIIATADSRTNSVIVQASPRDLLEVQTLIQRIDVSSSAAVNELRVINLENSLASDLASILQTAISAQGGTSQSGQSASSPAAPGAAALAARNAAGLRSSMLRFLTIDSQGKRQISSGILSDVSITPDTRANTLIVSAPAESMDLIEALVRQLDLSPAAESQIKVFTIVNGDASSLAQMLATLFNVSTAGLQGGGGGGLGLFQQQTTAGTQSIIPLKLGIDTRTNSIIASGPTSTLDVVEAILLRLDDGDVRQRKMNIYRLRNSPAAYVAQAIQQLLTNERQLVTSQQGLVSAFEQLQRDVVVVAEEVSNSLIVSTTPQYYEEIRRIVEELDARPLMVTVQVLIAEVTLENTDEFGIELGLQDSILFDRSIVGANANTPGYHFNNAPLGNGNSPAAMANSGNVGGQGLSNFAMGRTNSNLGFGGLVLSASSENVSILLRALNQSRRIDVLSRPQITTLDNQIAFIRIGQRVPFVTQVNQTNTGTSTSTELTDVGLILRIQPRISPDGIVVMTLDTERTELGPITEGIPVSIAPNGEPVLSPIINGTTAQTTVSASDGQTIVVGGLLTKSKTSTHRRVPVISDIPVIGNLFRYDLADQRKTELLIIMTPRIVRSEVEAEIIKQVESSRMSWCLSDVVQLHGPSGLRSRSDEWTDAEVPTIYPALDPLGFDPNGKPVFDGMLQPGEVLLPDGEFLPAEIPYTAPGEVQLPTEHLPPPQASQQRSVVKQPTLAQGTPPSVNMPNKPIARSNSMTAQPSITDAVGGNETTQVEVSFEPPAGYKGSLGNGPSAQMPRTPQQPVR